MIVNIRIMSCVALIAFMLSIDASAQGKSDDVLFSFSDASPKLSGQANKGQVVATRSISINRKIASLDAGQIFMFPLLDGNTIEITAVSTSTLQNGDTLLKGSFGSNGDGSAIITFGTNATFANLSSTEHSYSISLDENQDTFLMNNKLIKQEIDKSNDMVYPPNFEPMSHLQEPANTSTNPRTAEMNSGLSEVTVLFIYSSEFANGFASPLTRINQMIAFSNDAYMRSGINIELKLAHAQQVNFNNSESIRTLLYAARNGTGDFTNVHAIRDQYYADMVAVLPYVARGGIGGIAFVNGSSPSFAYSVSQFAPYGSDSLFAHEIGHNLGSGHERISANSSQPDPCTGGYTGYACGHGNGSGRQGTIMSYLDDRAWSYVFSNPGLDCNGEPCGIAQGSPNAADNKTSFNITGPLIEAFRVDNTNDDDKDGVKNDVDNCRNVVNSNQLNTDGDLQGDACDSDDDNDGVNDPSDNCPLVSNPDQADANTRTPEGDVCEPQDGSNQLCLPVRAQNTKIVVICL